MILVSQLTQEISDLGATFAVLLTASTGYLVWWFKRKDDKAKAETEAWRSNIGAMVEATWNQINHGKMDKFEVHLERIDSNVLDLKHSLDLETQSRRMGEENLQRQMDRKVDK